MSLTNPPPWIGPLLCWNLVQSVTGLTVTFTPSTSPIRPIAAITTAILAYLLQVTMKTHFSGTRASGPLVAMCWVNVLNAIDLLVITQASYEAQLAYKTTKQEKKDISSTTTHESSLGWGRKLLFALEIPYNSRRINTPWTISRVPPFNPDNPTYVPSRTSFLLHSALKLLISAAILTFLTIDPNDPHLSSVITQLNTDKTVLFFSPFHSFDARKFKIQCLFTLSFAIVTRATIVGGYTSLAFIFVLCGSSPSNWPPIAGGFGDAYTLAGLWGSTWHQLLRRPLTSPTTFLLTTLLGIPPKSPLAHWTRILLTFTASGIIHSTMDIAFGVPVEKTGGVWFFTLQIVGLLVETFFQRFVTWSGVTLNTSSKKVVGYIWVAGFLGWSVTVWINPVLVGLWEGRTRVMSPWLGMAPTAFAL
ncbi:membrane bound O-acyl transferase family-domain-containing protein [Aspergillus cavernicola]|uniref:Membrane bound O-acyl transferase family-domain-containing protein n=1 Tax=Aspergillus cavernicola TaxID=176166 RepID=A0ABR4HDB1_9EURO